MFITRGKPSTALASTLAFLFFGFIAAAADNQELPGKTYALLIGLNYDNSPEMSSHRLRYSVNDVHAVRNMLVSFCGVEEGDIDILTDTERPDSAIIREKLRQFAGKAGNRDRLLLFYSGHGMGVNDSWAMVPYGFDKNDFEKTLLWNRDITAILESSNAAETILISDSCYSGSEKSLDPATFRVRNPDYGSKNSNSPWGSGEMIELQLGGWGDLRGAETGAKSLSKIVRLCSSGSGEVSREYAPAQKGAFTHVITERVESWWKNNEDRSLTLGRLYADIIPDVQKFGRHTPFLTDNGEDVVFSRKDMDGRDPSRTKGRVYALLIGLRYMNDSDMPEGNKLNYTENGVREIRDALLSHGGVEKSDLTVLTDADRPDRRKILSALRDLSKRAGPDDRIIFFFSGHGGKRGNYGNIIPHGYRGWSTGVAYSEDIKPIMEKSRAASKWMIIDACHSGLKSFGFDGMKTLDGYVPEDETAGLDMLVSERDAYSDDGSRAAPFNVGQRVRELIRFTGAHGGEYTYESGTIRMGYFAHFLAKGLNGDADRNRDGEITGGELSGYVTPKVLDATDNKQKPRLTENGAGIILAATRPASPPAPSAPPPSQSSGSNKGKVHALLIGLRYMNDSDMPEGNKLNYTENDVREIRDALLSHGGVEKSDLTVLTDTDRPDRNKILSALRDLSKRAGPDDRIIFFFSGHGGKNGNLGNIIPHGYRGWPTGVAYSKDIEPIMKESRAASKWMIIDACHSGLKSFGFDRVKTLDGYVPEDETAGLDMLVSEHEAYSDDGSRAAPFNVGQRVRELIRFTGAHGGEYTYESGTIRMGYFAHFLAKGLNGDADRNRDGEITGGELSGYVTPKVLDATDNKQKPRLTENGANIILAATKRSQETQNHPDGKTALHLAVMSNDYSGVERMLASGTNVNETDRTGWTSLHYAANGRMARMLLSNGGKANARSGSGYTPLHIAAILNRTEVIGELLRNGADRGIKDTWGKTALHHALENKNGEAVQALRDM